LSADYQSAFEQYQVQLQNVKEYENTLLSNAETIIKTANLQILSGAINYLEWAMLINQSITKSGY
jgi:cobalt-zinc-cadmium resistance protein CzcA